MLRFCSLIPMGRLRVGRPVSTRPGRPCPLSFGSQSNVKKTITSMHTISKKWMARSPRRRLRDARATFRSPKASCFWYKSLHPSKSPDGALSRRDGALSRHDGALSRHDRALSRHDGALKCLFALATKYFGSFLKLEIPDAALQLRFGPCRRMPLP